MWAFLYTLASPKTFYRYSKRIAKVCYSLSLLSFLIGIVWALVFAPSDYQQGDAFRIIYIHVPAAFLSLFVYAFMSFQAVLLLVWRIKLSGHVLKNAAAFGATMTLLALVTGAIWGKPMWGTWWVWDARLTSELILLFIYLGVLSFFNVINDFDKGARLAALFTLVGFIDIPIIHYSVNWWNTLHQGATVASFDKPKIALSMLYPLLVMIFAFMNYFVALLMTRTREDILLRERKARWAKPIIGALLNESRD